MKRFFFAVVIGSLLTACASAPQEIPDYPGGTACIHGGLANPYRQMTQLEAHVTLSSRSVVHAGPYGKHFVPAGKNALTVVGGLGSELAMESILVSLNAGREYKVRAHLVRRDPFHTVFHFAIVDVSSRPEIVAYEFDAEPFDPKRPPTGPRDLTLSPTP